MRSRLLSFFAALGPRLGGGSFVRYSLRLIGFLVLFLPTKRADRSRQKQGVDYENCWLIELTVRRSMRSNGKRKVKWFSHTLMAHIMPFTLQPCAGLVAIIDGFEVACFCLKIMLTLQLEMLFNLAKLGSVMIRFIPVKVFRFLVKRLASFQLRKMQMSCSLQPRDTSVKHFTAVVETPEMLARGECMCAESPACL